MYRKIICTFFSLTIIPIAIVSVQQFASVPLGNTFVWWVVEVIILFILLIARLSIFKRENKKNFRFVKWYLIWVSICLVRGVMISEIYWDYKALISNTFILYLPLVSYVVTDNEMLQSLLSYFVKYALPLAIPVFFFLDMGAWGWYLYPVTFLMLFFPVLKLHWKVGLIAISLLCILGDISARSHVIKYSIPILFLSFYYLRFFIASSKIMKFARIIFIIAPWVMFFLAVSGIFNVFKMNEYIHSDKIEQESTYDSEGNYEQSMIQDSRTFIYEEVIHSAIKYKYWLFGRSPARGNETVAFASLSEITGRKERLRNEANIPNVFTWMGLIGVILFFIIYYKASYMAIFRSNNMYSKLIGVFVAFRWLYAWIEDCFLYDTNNLVIWILIGACLSRSFRSMNNLEVKLWARGIFDKKYALAYKKYTMSGVG